MVDTEIKVDTLDNVDTEDNTDSELELYWLKDR